MIIGIDLSLRATGLCAVPLDWGGDWERVAFATVGESLSRSAPVRDRVRRLISVSQQILTFASSRGATVAVFEEYAFAQRGAGSREIAELGGVVKVGLQQHGVEVRTVPASQARKALLGKVPRKDPKGAVEAALRAAGAPFQTTDEAEAFAVANAVLSELGATAFLQEAA